MKINRKGSVLVLVMVIFAVLAILTTSILYIFSTNTKQIVAQKNNIKAYYIAKSGVEIGFAVLQKKPDLLGTSTAISLSEDLYLTKAGGKIKSLNIKKISDAGEYWIEIAAEGIHIETNTSSTVKMKYLTTNPSFRKWYQ